MDGEARRWEMKIKTQNWSRKTRAGPLRLAPPASRLGESEAPRPPRPAPARPSPRPRQRAPWGRPAASSPFAFLWVLLRWVRRERSRAAGEQEAPVHSDAGSGCSTAHPRLTRRAPRLYTVQPGARTAPPSPRRERSGQPRPAWVRCPQLRVALEADPGPGFLLPVPARLLRPIPLPGAPASPRGHSGSPLRTRAHPGECMTRCHFPQEWLHRFSH